MQKLRIKRQIWTYIWALQCRPADLGIDVVCESATKYLNGHSDISAGVVAGSAEFIKRVQG